MSAFNLLHLVTKSQPVALRACGLPSGSCRDKKDCKVVFSQEELRKRLTPLQYHVTQEKGTESAFEGEYTHHKAQGIYKCVVCGTPLFRSETKFDSNSGWPSFYDVISPDAIAFNDDFSYGMHRIEISCSQVRHLGLFRSQDARDCLLWKTRTSTVGGAFSNNQIWCFKPNRSLGKGQLHSSLLTP
uniref:Peptide-methionine (R)-S-oxide reductase n=1 Tax=Taeniopygia guttata TaxID=59729 RepID=H0Z886_TAEGU